jgi:hypothetical protein
MEQKEFSNFVVPRLLEQFPQFKEVCIYTPNGVVYIAYKSNQGLLTLLISTQDKEITIGFSENENLFGFHTHMSMFGATTPGEEIEEAINLINDIIGDRETIIYSSIEGYMLGDINEIRKHQQPDELIGTTVWSKL